MGNVLRKHDTRVICKVIRKLLAALVTFGIIKVHQQVSNHVPKANLETKGL